MVTVEVEVTDNGLIDAYDYLLQYIPDFVYQTMKATVEEQAPLMLADFKEEPGPPKRPIVWTSEKQRKYVMMKLARKEMKHERTHRHSEGWKYEVIYVPGSISSVEVYNEVPRIEYVEGYRQQAWLATTGWIEARPLAELWSDELEDHIEDALIIGFEEYGRS